MLTGEEREALRKKWLDYSQSIEYAFNEDTAEDFWLNVIEKQLEGKVMAIREEMEESKFPICDSEDFRSYYNRVTDELLGGLKSLHINKKQP